MRWTSNLRSRKIQYHCDGVGRNRGTGHGDSHSQWHNDENQIEHMPSFGRDVFQLIQLAPGVFGDGAQGHGGGGHHIPGTQGPGGTGGNTGISATENGPQAVAQAGSTRTPAFQLTVSARPAPSGAVQRSSPRLRIPSVT